MQFDLLDVLMRKVTQICQHLTSYWWKTSLVVRKNMTRAPVADPTWSVKNTFDMSFPIFHVNFDLEFCFKDHASPGWLHHTSIVQTLRSVYTSGQWRPWHRSEGSHRPPKRPLSESHPSIDRPVCWGFLWPWPISEPQIPWPLRRGSWWFWCSCKEWKRPQRPWKAQTEPSASLRGGKLCSWKWVAIRALKMETFLGHFLSSRTSKTSQMLLHKYFLFCDFR